MQAGFPAHAGWTHSEGAAKVRGRRLPRTRGDEPVSAEYLRKHDPASPHTRGWTVRSAAAAEPDEGFPAHAGMDPRISSSARSGARLPRTRGDGPGQPSRPRSTPGASPHTRGWTPTASDYRRRTCGFPAHENGYPCTNGRIHAAPEPADSADAFAALDRAFAVEAADDVAQGDEANVVDAVPEPTDANGSASTVALVVPLEVATAAEPPASATPEPANLLPSVVDVPSRMTLFRATADTT